MIRTEEYEYRQDVYTVLARASSYRASSFLSTERKSYKNDNVFFAELLDSKDVLLGKAFMRGKMMAYYIEPFLKSYKRIVKDDFAYLVYKHQAELEPFIEAMKKKVREIETRFVTVFDRYWRSRCERSIKVWYYLLLANANSPKYEGLGAESSIQLYGILLSVKEDIDKYLSRYTSPVVSHVEPPSPQGEVDTDLEPFLNCVYEKVVSVEFPVAADILKVWRSSFNSDIEFYQELLALDITEAKRILRVGEVSAKNVVRLCEMMRRIIQNSGAVKVFEKRDVVNVLIPHIARHFGEEDIRTYHAFQRFLNSCEDSVLYLYLRVVGLPSDKIKIPGLSAQKSLALFNELRSLLPEIDEFVDYSSSKETDPGQDPFLVGNSMIVTTESKESLLYNPALHSLVADDDEIKRIVSINERIGHLPMFSIISYFFKNLENKKKTIALNCINTIKGNPIDNYDSVASTLSISRERVRQLRGETLKVLLSYPRMLKRAGLVDDYTYPTQSEYDFNLIREQEGVDFSNEYITICIYLSRSSSCLIGDINNALLKSTEAARRLFLVPKQLNQHFNFSSFICAIDAMVREKRFYPFREDLDILVKGLLKKKLPDEVFYSVVKECRQILTKAFPDNIINSQVYFPANARKSIPKLIEDVLRENNRPMTADELCVVLNQRFPDLGQVPSKIGPNALRNSNIVAVSRSSTYALLEWNYTEKRGGTIRDLASEYLYSLLQPIAPLRDICDYISQFRDGVKLNSVKANLLAETSNRYSLYIRKGILYIGLSDYRFDSDFILQEKKQGRRSFSDSISLLETFVKENKHFPFSSGVGTEEKRLCRFYSVCKSNIKKGLLTPEEQAEIERIEKDYQQFKGKKEREVKVDLNSWISRLESFVSYITFNDILPPETSDEALWYKENLALYEKGLLSDDQQASFKALKKIVARMETSSV